MSAIESAVFKRHLAAEPKSDLLRRSLTFEPLLPARNTPTDAIPWDPESRRIERLKMYRPRAGAQQADVWLGQTVATARQSPHDEATIGAFAAALSTWSGIQRTLGQLDDATLAAHHALSILQAQPLSTRAGFACQRAAFVLGDLGEINAGLDFAQRAVAIHQATPGGQHHAGIALAGVGAFQLFYRRAFSEARAAFTMALHALGTDDQMLLVGASHGIAYSYLMEERFGDARESLTALQQLVPALEPDQDVRLRWLEAEIAAADGDHERALALYDEVFSRSLEVTEPAGSILVSFDAARILLEQQTTDGEWWGWQRRILPIVDKLTRVEQAALEPYLDALAAGKLDRELLDQTTVAFKKASNRMLLGMGRSGAAGRPELRGQLAA